MFRTTVIITFLSMTYSFSSSIVENKAIKPFLEKDEYFKTNDSFAKYKDHDFSDLLLTNRGYSYGFIGANYQRFDICPISITKMNNYVQQYSITGKTRVKNNICDFNGILTISEITEFKEPFHFIDNPVPETLTRGFIIGKYELQENPLQLNSGKFDGDFILKW